MELQEQTNKIFTKRFISLFFTNMSIFLVFYGLITTLPLYAIGELGKSDDDSGLLVTVFLISAIIVRPFSGKLLDLFGKKRLLILSLVLYFACTVLYLFFKPFLLLLALRFFQGIWFSIATTASGSLAADIIPKRRKGAGLGYFAMSTNLAVVFGPFIGLLIIQYSGFDMLFIVLSVLVAIGGLLALTIQTKDLPKPVVTDRSFKFSFNDLFERSALPLAALASLIAFSYASVLSFLSLYAEQKDLLSVASYFFAVFAVAMISVRPFTGRIYDTIGAKFVIIPSFFIFALGLIILGNADQEIPFLLSAIFIGAGYGTLTTSFQSLCIQSTSIQRSGYATATYFTLFDIGIAIGSYLLGMVAVKLGYEFVYYIAAFIIIVVFALYMLVLNRQKHKIEQ
ncbi:MFS transporter [Solibacillus sp. FSL W7-1472]|uniref:MFS transporter n=1 Tax=Solibacillus TaxID=648800 RepID=UPI00203D6538|nr:MFS transporter [Solibacillus isronensis]MCM3721800.1 MFS transporter [Solibacillus isronensis]